MTNTVALLVGHTVPASKYSLVNTILIVAATLLFVVTTVVASALAMTWWSKRHPAHEQDDLHDRLDE